VFRQINNLYQLFPKKIRLFCFFLIPLLLLLQSKPLLARNSKPSTNNPWQYASFPVENFQAFTSGFGYRISPVTNQWQFHYGLDLAAPYGSYVRNWWSGKVVELSGNTGCGTMIKIESGRWQHVYCHLIGKVQDLPNGRRYLLDSEGGIMLTLGQTISYGTRIARVGVSGNTTGPHLHWGIKFDGQYIDPSLVIQEMYKNQVAKANHR